MSFDNYLRSFAKDKHNSAQVVTHTRIGSTAHNVYGGSYSVALEKKAEFYETYYKHIFGTKGVAAPNIHEHLTELQIQPGKNIAPDGACGPMLVDFDFRYNKTVTDRKHTEENVDDIVNEYLELLKTYYEFDKTAAFTIYVLEKPRVNTWTENDVNKDGIHMVIGLQVDHVVQAMIRRQMLEILPQKVFPNLPIINSWDTVLDEGITKGTTGWQVLGSRKPGNDAYALHYTYAVTYDPSDGEFCINSQIYTPTTKISLQTFMELSAQYTDHPKFPLTPEMKVAYEKAATENKRSGSKTHKLTPSRHRILLDGIEGGDADDTDNEDGDAGQQPIFTSLETLSLRNIRSKAHLEQATELMLHTFASSSTTCHLPEIHHYALSLPEMFYKAGSHELNRKVAFALKDTHKHLFLSWIGLRAKAADFDYATIPKLFGDWNKYFNQSQDAQHRLTKKSIIYWAKTHAPDDYQRIKGQSINSYIDATLKYEKDHPEYDVAFVLHQLFKDEYAFIISGKAEEWYRFENHRWRLDPKGSSLQLKISTCFKNYYTERQRQYQNELAADAAAANTTAASDQGETLDVTVIEKQAQEHSKFLKSRITSLGNLIKKLGSDTYKSHLMAQARLLFLDNEFEERCNENRFLLGFNNGVYDLKEKCFRDGRPDDYITFTTKHDYMDVEKNMKNPTTAKAVAGINDFMEKIYPEADMRQFMWEHLASSVIGTNPIVNQIGIHMLGNGSNGKTKVTDMMKYAFGDYYDKGAVQLITYARGKAEGASPQILKLKGKRYIIFPEPQKGAVLNDGIYKELTGEADLIARGLYKSMDLIFANQANYVVATNNLLKIDDMTDAIWRRLRLVLHKSKFVKKELLEQAKLENKYVFEIDPDMDIKIESWGKYFISMLINVALRTEGRVADCQSVMAASNNYRNSEDIITSFLSEKVATTKLSSDRISHAVLWTTFRTWFAANKPGDKMNVKQAELFEAMTKRFKNEKQRQWCCVKIVSDDVEEEEEEEYVMPKFQKTTASTSASAQ